MSVILVKVIMLTAIIFHCVLLNAILLNAILLNGFMPSVVTPFSNFLVFEENGSTCGLNYKTVMIVIMTIVSDATIWSITYVITDDAS